MKVLFFSLILLTSVNAMAQTAYISIATCTDSSDATNQMRILGDDLDGNFNVKHGALVVMQTASPDAGKPPIMAAYSGVLKRVGPSTVRLTSVLGNVDLKEKGVTQLVTGNTSFNCSLDDSLLK